jgi:histidinol-phosphatase (PHP family)
MVDLHVHTRFSPDASLDMELACRVAAARGLKVIGFADHAEFLTADEAYYTEHFDGNRILAEIEEMRKAYEGKLEILFGVEVGYLPEKGKEIGEFLETYPFDYAIGSVHYVEDMLVSTWTRKTEADGKSFMPYFEMLLSAAQSGLFQILGHLDYVRKYMMAPENYPYQEYAGIVNQILDAAVQSDVTLEINTSGWRHATDEPYPGKNILSSFIRKGGTITVSSDAHKDSEVAYANRRARKLLDTIGYKEVQIFRKRQRYSISL